MAITPRESSTRSRSGKMLNQSQTSMTNQASHVYDDKIHTSKHFVQFYTSDDFLLEAVSSFIGAGLGAGAPCMVIGTPAHCAGIERCLEANGLNLDMARAQRKYVAFDAADTLAQFMDNEMPDPTRFFEVITSLIAQVDERKRPLYIFGEMVALLHSEGKIEATIKLEALWNELSKVSRPFVLLCAYPIDSFAGEAHEDTFIQVCQQHTQIIPEESFTTLTTSEERLRAVSLLQQKAASLQAEVTERKKLEQQREAFLGLVTHELKNPLTALQGNVQIAQRLLTRLFRRSEHLPPEDQQLLEDVLTMLSRGQQQLRVQNRLINDLLAISHIEQDKLELCLAEVDLFRLVCETVQDYQAAHPARAINLHLPEQDSIPIHADRDRLQQVVSNFLNNALKFAPPHEPIEVGITLEATNARVWVQDRGPGLTSEQQEHIWQRFYQVSETPVQGDWKGGLGLGLYISHHLILRQQGQVGVESIPGEGATFWFTLPLSNV